MSDTPALPGFEDHTGAMSFAPTRAQGLAQLGSFVPKAGKHYASQRNYDFGPDRRGNVSVLSPWIRHRLITEEEVLRATLQRHDPRAAEKFVQEVFWRGYFKGWLEQRPSVWHSYKAGVIAEMDHLGPRTSEYEDAIAGRTGIDAFDHWARELVETGYLHNHARMWFASIWIFTLRLPWQLGADFFLRHLMDGDAASNTLSWRWVGGLHTKGKTYQARASNIAKYTDGQFHPGYSLAHTADPLDEEEEHVLCALPEQGAFPEDAYLLLLTEENNAMEFEVPSAPAAVLGAMTVTGRSPFAMGDQAKGFTEGAIADAVRRAETRWSLSARHATEDWAEAIIAAAQEAKLCHVVTAYAPVGPVADVLSEARSAIEAAGLTFHTLWSQYDALVWPHATKGFFGLKKKIPRLLGALDLPQ